jgi:predicted phage terminase large subunit-like protein
MNAHSPQFAAAEMMQGLQQKQLFFFVWRAFEHLHPSDSFLPSWHVQAICHALTQVMLGNIRRLVITVPPRYGKSICTSVALPAFLMGHTPGSKIMVASYGSDLANNHARDFKSVITSDWYRTMFPRMAIKIGGNRTDELVTTANGVRKAISRDGAATGFGADWIIVDDVMKAADANSEIERRKASDFFRQTLLSRLNDKATGRVIVIAQRLHEDDLNGALIESGDYAHLFLPAIAGEDQQVPVGFGQTQPWRKGEPLCPEREPLPVLRQIELELGKANFAAQYLGNPTPQGGNRVRWEWFGQHELEDPQREEFYRIVQSWDTGMTAEPTSDFSVGMCWGHGLDGCWYLLDLIRERLDFPDLKRRVSGFAQRWQADTVLIENAGSGLPLLQQLRQEARPWIYCPIQPLMDKITRLEAQTARLETGKFLLPREAHWREEFRRELLGFPRSRYDDQVDALSQFVEYVESSRGSQGVMRRDPATGRPTVIKRPKPIRPVIQRPVIERRR